MGSTHEKGIESKGEFHRPALVVAWRARLRAPRFTVLDRVGKPGLCCIRSGEKKKVEGLAAPTPERVEGLGRAQ